MNAEGQPILDAIRSAKSAIPASARLPATSREVGKIDQTDVAFRVFQSLLETDGIRAALYALLRRTDYRFIAIFRFQDGMAASVVYVDRENLNDLQAAEVADTATYCSFARDDGGAFITIDALADARTVAHVAREVVRAYCGIPLSASDGSFIGTLCHYDLVPRDPEQLDPVLLVRAADTLVESGLIPPYPAR